MVRSRLLLLNGAPVGSKNLLLNFGTLYDDAIDGSDSNPQLRSSVGPWIPIPIRRKLFIDESIGSGLLEAIDR